MIFHEPLYDIEGKCLHIHWDSMIGYCHDCKKVVSYVLPVKVARELAVEHLVEYVI